MFNEAPESTRPTTAAGRRLAGSASRTYSGVNHDWLKGRRRSSRKNAELNLDDASLRSCITKDVAVRIMRSANARISSVGYSVRGRGTVENPPVSPTIVAPVHVITLSSGTRKIPDLQLLSLGNLVRILRERENVSIASLSRSSGVSSGCISMLESEKTTPRLSTVLGVVNALHLSDSEARLVLLRASQAMPERVFSESGAEDAASERRISRSAHMSRARSGRASSRWNSCTVRGGRMKVERMELSSVGDEDEIHAKTRMAGHPAYASKA